MIVSILYDSRLEVSSLYKHCSSYNIAFRDYFRVLAIFFTNSESGVKPSRASPFFSFSDKFVALDQATSMEGERLAFGDFEVCFDFGEIKSSSS